MERVGDIKFCFAATAPSKSIRRLHHVERRIPCGACRHTGCVVYRTRNARSVGCEEVGALGYSSHRLDYCKHV